jgi:adenylate kinase family enzyme
MTHIGQLAQLAGLSPAAWRRIHIIGGAGSGKTTLAGQLAARLDLPAYDLDAVAYEHGAGQKRSLDARRAGVYVIANQPGWIVEGGYLWWTEPLVAAADVVIWIDLPWPIAAWRVIKRHLRASLTGTNKHRGVRKLFRFVRWTRRYYTSTSVQPAPDDDTAMSRAATAAMLRPYMGKVVQCRRPSTVKTVLVQARNATQDG